VKSTVLRAFFEKKAATMNAEMQPRLSNPSVEYQHGKCVLRLRNLQESRKDAITGPPCLTKLEGLTEKDGVILDTYETDKDRDSFQPLSTAPCGAMPSDTNQALSAIPPPLSGPPSYSFCAILEIFWWMVLRKESKPNVPQL
jgi:hypothetical protein